MSIRTTCQACGHVFHVKNEFAGIKAKCSSCGAVLLVPQAPADSTPTRPVAAAPPKPLPAKARPTPVPTAQKKTAPPISRPAARTAAPAASEAVPLIQVGDQAASTSSRITGHPRRGKRTGRNPNTALLAAAAVLAVMLLVIVGVGVLWLSGAIGGRKELAQQNGDAQQVSLEGLAPAAGQGGSSTKVDSGTAGLTPRDRGFEATGIDSVDGLVQRISPDAYQTETSAGPVGVKVTSAKLGRLPDGPQQDKQYLLVTIQLQNKDAEQLRYATWDGQALLNLPVVLMDSSGRLYRQKPLTKSDDGSWEIAESLPDSGAHPVHVGDGDFDAQVLQADEPVLVDFYADWCPPCRALAPTIERLAGATAGKAKIVKVNVDTSPLVKKRYGIRGIPHLILFHDGEIAAQNPGRSFEVLMAAINRVAPGAGELVAGGETLEPHGTVEQTLVFEPGRDQPDFLRLELPADAIGGQGVLTLEIPWTMIAAGSDDRVANVGQG